MDNHYWGWSRNRALKRLQYMQASTYTVLQAKSDSEFILCLQSYQGQIIERLLVYLSYSQDRINTQVIDRFALAVMECTS